MSPPIRLLLLCDDIWLSTTLGTWFSKTADLHVVGETANVSDLPQLCRVTDPHILLMGGVAPH